MELTNQNAKELPPGWVLAKLEQCAQVIDPHPSHRTPPCEDEGIPYISIQDFDKRSGTIDFSGARQVSHSVLAEHIERYALAAGDFIIGKIGTVGGAFEIPSERFFAISANVVLVRPSAGLVNSRYLLHQMRSSLIEKQYDEGAKATSQSAFGIKKVRELVIALPPLNEQKRIADKLESLLGRVDACRERLERVPILLRRFRQSVLAAATSGKLTEDWREQAGAEVWTPTTVKAVSDVMFDGPFGSHLKTADYSDSGVRVIRLENLGHLRFLNEKETYVSVEKFQTLKRHELKERDVLFSSFIDEEIRVCVFPGTRESAINKSDCFCIRVNSSLCLPEYLALRLACHTTFKGLEDSVHGVTRPRVNLTQLKGYEFGLPSLEEQGEIVRRTKLLFRLIENTSNNLRLANETIDRLIPALLAKAFRGELCLQDPADESAAELLARGNNPTNRHLKTAGKRKKEKVLVGGP